MQQTMEGALQLSTIAAQVIRKIANGRVRDRGARPACQALQYTQASFGVGRSQHPYCPPEEAVGKLGRKFVDQPWMAIAG